MGFGAGTVEIRSKDLAIIIKDYKATLSLMQFIAMGQEQRTAIRCALNDDANKLISEGDESDPQLRRLRREMDEVNKLFDEFEKRARQDGKIRS